MKKLFRSALLLLSAFQLFSVSAFSQTDGYTFLCDSNGVGLPGFYLNWSNLVGNASTAQLPSNVVVTAQLNAASNNVLTNVTAQLVSQSNTFAAYTGALLGNNPLSGSTNSGYFAGSSNSLANASASAIVGGQTNAVSNSLAALIAGGVANSIAYSGGSVVDGGTADTITLSPYCAIIAGNNNRISRSFFSNTWSSAILAGSYNGISDGYGSVVLGGTSNEVGHVYGFNGAYDGPFYSFNSAALGVLANPIHNNVFIWSDGYGGLFRSTATNQFLIRASGGVGINTNNPGTNALAVRGNADFTSASLGGVNLLSLFSPTATSNGLSATWNYNLLSVSNALQAQVTVNSNAILTASNALVSLVATTSNTFAVSIRPAKAFSAVLPATYASIGIGFSTPLMPDGNYSVSLFPQDAATAGALVEMQPYVAAKNNSGFTLYVLYATNAFNLNFECQVRENTQ